MKGKALKKLFLWIVGIILFCVILFFLFRLFVTFERSDIPPVDDSHLMPSSEILSEEENAFYNFQLAAENTYWSEEDQEDIRGMLEDDSVWNAELAQELVDKNEKALEYFNQGIDKKGYQEPSFQKDNELLMFPEMSGILKEVRFLSTISLLKSKILLMQGDETEAMKNALEVFKIGGLLQNSSSRTSMVIFLVGLNLKNSSILFLEKNISISDNLSSDILLEFVLDMEKYKENGSGLAESFKMEYLYVTNSQEVEMNSQSTSFYYKPNKTKKLLVNIFDSYIENSNKICGQWNYPEKSLNNPSYLKFIFTENSAGKLLTDLLLSSFQGIQDRRCNSFFSTLKVQVKLASEAYKKDNGQYPETLDELYPEYMPKNYEEFNNKEIIYNSETGEISLKE